MATFQTELGVVTQAQLVALGSAGVVFLFLLVANLAMCRLYRRATGEPRRQVKRDQRKQSDVWVYHVYRTKPPQTTGEAASEQILKKLRASHDNLQAAIEAAEVKAGTGNTLGQEECQVLEELEATADLFLHDNSQPGSRHSSLRSIDLDPCTLAGDLAGDFSDLDKVSVTSVKMADFENDPAEEPGRSAEHQGGGRGRKGRRTRIRKRSEETGKGERDENDLPSTLPVAEFHNEAFDFAHEAAAGTAIECVQDVEL